MAWSKRLHETPKEIILKRNRKESGAFPKSLRMGPRAVYILMKDILVAVALLFLGIIIARLILSDTGLMGASRDLFESSVKALTQ